MRTLLPSIVATLALSFGCIAQESQSPAATSVGSTSGSDGGSSLKGTIEYKVPLEPIFETNFDELRGGAAIWDISPEVVLNFSEGPEFNSIVVKLTGNRIKMGTTTVAGVTTPDTTSFNVVPVSLGFEADQSFDNVSMVAEVGFVPFRLGRGIGGNDKFKIGNNPKIGIFAQAGYKFGVRDESDSGNAADASSEDPDSAIGRIKLSGDIKIPIATFGDSNPASLLLLAKADYWYDFVNSDTYDQSEVTLRLSLNEKTNLDFKYENGSGAPNFNKGEQFGVFLNTTF